MMQNTDYRYDEKAIHVKNSTSAIEKMGNSYTGNSNYLVFIDISCNSKKIGQIEELGQKQNIGQKTVCETIKAP